LTRARLKQTVSSFQQIISSEVDMYRMKRTSSSPVVVAAGLLLATLAASGQAQGQPASPGAAPSLSYEFFRDKVEPVFLTKRPGHARCVMCHTVNNAPFHLVPLSPGATAWNEEQSKQNFELVHRVAAPGVIDSPLVKHPLAQEAGGDPHHGGGQQFASQSDPDWQTLKAFVSGAK
jgi:hypothetical protein